MNTSTLNTLVGLIEAMELKDRIKEAMDGAKLTKAAFSRAAKVSPGAVTQWLTGETKSLKASTAGRIESATGYRSGWLVNGTLPKKTTDQRQNAEEPAEGDALASVVRSLAGYLAGMDARTRLRVGRLLFDLADEPESLAHITTMMRAVLQADTAEAAAAPAEVKPSSNQQPYVSRNLPEPYQLALEHERRTKNRRG